MQLRHRIAVVLLTVLAGLPISGMVCATMCDSASSAAVPHHGSGQKCEASARLSDGPQIDGYTEHDCSTHDGTMRPSSTTAAGRADVTATSAPSMLGVVSIESAALRDSKTFFGYSSPPGPVPLTTTRVLRV